jgi:hypothetical protein
VQSEAYEKLQAEINELKEANQLLARENTTIKSRNTRLNNQKGDVEKSLQKTKDALETQFRMTETRTKKMKKAQEEIQLLLDKPCDQCEEYEKLLEAEEERYRELSDHAVKLKQKVAASSRLDNQVTDETFREAMSCAFVAIKDCFWGVLRKQNFSKSMSLGFVINLINSTPDITVKSTDLPKDLDKYLPGYKDNTKNDKIYFCILVMAVHLVDVVKAKKAFGWSEDKLIRAATRCYAKMPGKPHEQPTYCMETRQETEPVYRASECRSAQEGQTMALAHKRNYHRQGPRIHGNCKRNIAGIHLGGTAEDD